MKAVYLTKEVLDIFDEMGYSQFFRKIIDGLHTSMSRSDVPSSQTNVLVQDTYPITGRNGISDNGAANIWWHYPIFKVGSYAQITNNMRYPNNPDEGTCMPASMCGALYKEIHLNTNYISQLPPVNPDCGTRVGYFATTTNLLPFRTNVPNILY